MSSRDHVVGIDLGTSCTRVLVGRAGPDDQIEVLGYGISKSDGLRKGAVVNIEKTVQSLETALHDAHKMSGRRIPGECAEAVLGASLL